MIIKSKFIICILIVLILSGFILNNRLPDGRYQRFDVRIFRNTPAWELAKAVNSQNTRRIAQISERNPELLMFEDPHHGLTLLIWAVGTEKYRSARALLEVGACPNILPSSGATALFHAASFSFVDRSANRDPRFVTLLLEYGADPNIGFAGNPHSNNNTIEIGETPLMRSIGAGIEKTKALVEAGADINFRTESGMNAAIWALLNGGPNRTLDMLEYSHYLIVEKKADVTGSYHPFFGGVISDDVRYPVYILRNWIYPIGSPEHKLKMEIVEEFARQGVDYWATEINAHQFNSIQRLYPDTWEEFILLY